MLWIKAFHIIFAIAWFAGLFYLPRLFVYHADTKDIAGQERFKIMEHKLYYYITTPAGIITTLLGFRLAHFNTYYYLHVNWMHVKVFSVFLLWVFQAYCGHLMRQFKQNRNQHSSRFYRWLNEAPTVLLLVIVIMVVVQPKI